MIFASFFGICRRDDSVFEPVPSRSNAGGSVLDCITQTSSTAKEAATIVTLSAVSSNKGAASGDVDRTDRPLDARSGNDAQLLKSGGRSCNPRYDAERLRGSWHPGAKPDRFNAMQLGQKFGYPLATLGYSVLRDVANELGLPLTQLEAFCLAVDLYMPKNDYHNRLHVADVVQLMHLQCSEGGPIFEECRDPLVKLSALTAALVHDLNHPGYNNNFLRLTNDPLVQKFGGEAPSEHMHIALFEQLAAEPELDFLKPLGPSNRARLSTLVREMVLATDMPKHMQYIVAEFPKNPEQLLVAKLSLAMKTADLAHCIRNFKVHRKFVDMLKAEFYAQGDREKHYIGNSSLGMERDEKIEDIAKSQMNFLSVYIRPLYGKWQSLADFPLVSEMQASLDRNICSWEQLLPRQETAPHYIDAKASSKSSRRSTSQATSASNQRVVNLAQIYSMTSWNLMEIDAVLNQLWGGEDDTWLLRMSNSYPSLKPGDTDKMEGPPVVGARRFTVGSVLSV